MPPIVYNQECPICLDPGFDNNSDSLSAKIVLTCGHCFHRECLIRSGSSCPMCRNAFDSISLVPQSVQVPSNIKLCDPTDPCHLGFGYAPVYTNGSCRFCWGYSPEALLERLSIN